MSQPTQKWTNRVINFQEPDKSYRTSAIEGAQLTSAGERTFQQDKVLPQWEYHCPLPWEHRGQAEMREKGPVI